MCYFNMGNASSALDDAIESQLLDPTYVKAYYRKGVALNALSRFAEANAAVEKGLSLKGDDKDMKALLAKIAADQAKQACGVKPARNTVSTTSGSASSTVFPKSTAAAAAAAAAPSASPKPVSAAPPASSKPAASEGSDNEGDDDDDNVLGNVRGYKKLADGRVTTFFNNELDETAKKLIGDIAPKKLEASSSAAAAALAVDPTGAGGSAWNSAGTYEERILSPWAAAELKQRIGALALCLDAASPADMPAAERAVYASAGAGALSSLQVEVALPAEDDKDKDKEAVVATGDAQVTMIRGKRKHLCDYTLEVHWAMTIRHEQEQGLEEVVHGKVTVLDLTADKEYEIDGSSVEVTHYNGSKASLHSLPRHAALLVANYVKASSTKQPRGLQKLIHDALMKFCDDLKTK
jgi:tetratricopeptide (TPR) repeat protein